MLAMSFIHPVTILSTLPSVAIGITGVVYGGAAFGYDCADRDLFY
jgi:hypothetical protein